MSDRVGKTLSELWPDVRVGDVARTPDGVLFRIDDPLVNGDFDATHQNGEFLCVFGREKKMWVDEDDWLHLGEEPGSEAVLVAESVSAEDFAPRYWSPEPSAEAMLDWAERNTVSKAMSGGGWIALGHSGTAHRAATMKDAIRAAMKEEEK